MNIININRTNLIVTQKVLNILSFVKYHALDYWKYKKYIKNNYELKNDLSSNNCIILGNGPSIKKLDLEKIKGNDIITVNRSLNTTVYKTLKPKYHIIIDKYVLQDVIDDVEKELNNPDSDTIFILHRSAIERLKKYSRARFVYCTKMASSKNSIRNDMTKNMTTFLNVLPFATLCATYLGYKNIVLLGNDFSFFTARKDQHFYDIESNVKRQESLYSDLAGGSIVLAEYRCLYNYVCSKGIDVVNATEGSLLDEIPQASLDEYLNKVNND